MLDGLSYLEKNGLEPRRLACSNILIDHSGNVKICMSVFPSCISRQLTVVGLHEGCVAWGHGRLFRDLGHVVMVLMQGYAKEDGAVGINDLERWPSDSLAIDFLSATTYASRTNQLLEVWHPPVTWKHC